MEILEVFSAAGGALIHELVCSQHFLPPLVKYTEQKYNVLWNALKAPWDEK